MATPQPAKSLQTFSPGGCVRHSAGTFLSVRSLAAQRVCWRSICPEHDFLTAPADFTVTATAPDELRLTGGHMTALMPGVVLEDRTLIGGGNSGLTYDYNPLGLAAGVPILDVGSYGDHVAADVVTVSLFGEGTDSAGQPQLCSAGPDAARPRVPEPHPGAARPHRRPRPRTLGVREFILRYPRCKRKQTGGSPGLAAGSKPSRCLPACPPNAGRAATRQPGRTSPQRPGRPQYRTRSGLRPG